MQDTLAQFWQWTEEQFPPDPTVWGAWVYCQTFSQGVMMFIHSCFGWPGNMLMQELFTGKGRCSSDRGCSTSMWRWACMATWSQSPPKNSMCIDIDVLICLSGGFKETLQMLCQLILGSSLLSPHYMPCLVSMLVVVIQEFFDKTFKHVFLLLSRKRCTDPSRAPKFKMVRF